MRLTEAGADTPLRAAKVHAAKVHAAKVHAAKVTGARDRRP